jgi:hypothetical protein
MTGTQPQLKASSALARAQLIALALLLPAVGAAVPLVLGPRLERSVRETELALNAARLATLEGHLTHTMWGVERIVRLAAADTRTRAALATDPPDTGTLEDALAEVQESAQLDWLALVSPDGRIMASSGVPELQAFRGVGLSGSELFKSALSGAGHHDVWFTGDVAVVITMAPVARGEELVGLVAGGRRLARPELEAGVLGVRGAHGEWFGTLPAPAFPLEGQVSTRTVPRLEKISLVTAAAAYRLPRLVWLPLGALSLLSLWLLLLTRGRTNAV